MKNNKITNRVRLVLILALAVFAFGRAMSQCVVTGWVHEQDSITPIEGATVAFSGIGNSGDTLGFCFLTDTMGCYLAEIDTGTYQVLASAAGYSDLMLQDSLAVTGDTLTVNFVLQELYNPVSYVAARQFADGMVRVSWSMREPILAEDFESGGFGLPNWNNSPSFPWVVDTVKAYSGDFCMKSGCAGHDGAVSQIEAAVYVPSNGTMRFFGAVSSESPWDVGQFFIDGEKRLEISGDNDWEEFQFDVEEGEHVFRWTYHKDASNSHSDDCFYVDDICFLLPDSTLRAHGSPQYFDLFRRRFDEPPVMLVSHLTDTVFMDLGWAGLPWGRYSWGISCHYADSRIVSDTVWSVLLDKDMTTVFDLDATTNIGVVPAGAWVVLSPVDGQGPTYQGDLNADGHLQLPNVYRNEYTLSVGLTGFEDFVSPDTIPIFEPTQYAIELREAIVPIDSLYVSSTGWAMWQMAGERLRGLQRFEVMLDSIVVGSTTERFFQFDTDTLVASRQYTAQVRPVYITDTLLWHSADWSYASSDNFEGCGQTLQWSLTESTVELSWQYPDSSLTIGAVVYRNGEYLGFVEENHFSDLDAAMQGEAEYCVRLVFGGPTDGTYYSMSAAECVEVEFPSYCDPPNNLEAEKYWENDHDYGAAVFWGERPAPIHHWLHYDNGLMVNSLGGYGEPVFFWGIRFSADTLAEYSGCSLKKVSLFDGAAGTYQLWVYVGGEDEPRTLVRSQNMTLSGSHNWHEEAIVPALELVGNEPIWIVVGQQGVSRPAVVCADMGHPDGRWVYVDERDGWTDMHTYNMHYTWMLRAYISNRSGYETRIGQDSYTLQNFNLYRSTDQLDYQKVAEIPYSEGQFYYQYRDCLADCAGNCFYYRLTASYLSDDGATCESDYAALLEQPEQQEAVVCDPSGFGEATTSPLNIYPNPSEGFIAVELEGLQKVMVYNALGQILFSKEAIGDFMRLDLSGFENGLYWIKVMSQNGAIVKSIVISR